MLSSIRGSRMAAALATVCAVLVTAGCGDKKKDSAEAQVAARVNKEEITDQQIGQVLQQQRGVPPQQAEAASRQILERLIDQELALQKAVDLKLDREPRLAQQLEAARRELMSRAYIEKVGEAASKPTPEEVASYYESTPTLFKERRVYSLQEITIDAKPEQLAQLRQRLEAARNIAEFIDYLKSSDIRFSANQAVRAAEQLPLASLATFAAMKDGQAILSPTPTGAQVIVLAASRVQPVTLEQATPAIEQFLLNERKRELLAKEIKALRDAATIEYVGKYAASAAAAGAPAPQPPAAEPAASSAKGPAPK